jgi:hypothetical protein
MQSLKVVHPVVCCTIVKWGRISQTQHLYYIKMWSGLATCFVLARGHPLEDNSIKSKNLQLPTDTHMYRTNFTATRYVHKLRHRKLDLDTTPHNSKPQKTPSSLYSNHLINNRLAEHLINPPVRQFSLDQWTWFDTHKIQYTACYVIYSGCQEYYPASIRCWENKYCILFGHRWTKKYNTTHVELPKVDTARRIQTRYIVPVILSTYLNVLHLKTGFICFYP